MSEELRNSCRRLHTGANYFLVPWRLVPSFDRFLKYKNLVWCVIINVKFRVQNTRDRGAWIHRQPHCCWARQIRLPSIHCRQPLQLIYCVPRKTGKNHREEAAFWKNWRQRSGKDVRLLRQSKTSWRDSLRLSQSSRRVSPIPSALLWREYPGNCHDSRGDA